MTRLFVVLAAIAACGSLSAQSSYSPVPDYQTIAGSSPGYTGYSYMFGRSSEGRVQLGDGNFHNVLPVIRRISYRPHDTMQYTNTYGVGREWKRVTIDMSNTSLAQMAGATGNTWSANATSTPVRVFSAAVVWPSRSGYAGTTAITNWTDYTFAFATPWVRANTGTLDSGFLADYRFSGGTLDGATPEKREPWHPKFSAPYLLDGWSVVSYRVSPQTFYHDTSTKGCKDKSAPPPFTRAYNFMNARHYGAHYRYANYRNTMFFSSYGYHVGPSAPYVTRLGLAINPTGVRFATGCERIYITGPSMGFAGLARSNGYTPTEYFGLGDGYRAAVPAFEGLPIITQLLWADTVTGETKISAACSVVIPSLGPLQSIDQAKRQCRQSHAHDGVATYHLTTSSGNPICKYN